MQKLNAVPKLINITSFVTLVAITILATGCSGFHIQNVKNISTVNQHNLQKNADNKKSKISKSYDVTTFTQKTSSSNNSLNNKNSHANYLKSLVFINTSGSISSKLFKRNLISKFKDNGVEATDYQSLKLYNLSSNNTSVSNTVHNSIQVSDISFREYNLLGVLTEVRMVLLAEVNYSYIVNGQLKKHSQSFQIQRNYQYNKASISTNRQQKAIIKKWLYDELAQRVSSQYFVLSQRNKL